MIVYDVHEVAKTICFHADKWSRPRTKRSCWAPWSELSASQSVTKLQYTRKSLLVGRTLEWPLLAHHGRCTVQIAPPTASVTICNVVLHSHSWHQLSQEAALPPHPGPHGPIDRADVPTGPEHAVGPRRRRASANCHRHAIPSSLLMHHDVSRSPCPSESLSTCSMSMALATRR